MATLSDYSLVNTRVNKYQQDLELEKPNDAFPFVVMETILGQLTNEIENSLVDGPQDRGIDAIYIEDEDDTNTTTIHIFQFKYTTSPDKITHNFPGTEIDKIITVIEDILSVKPELQNEVNPNLWLQVQNIHAAFNRPERLPRVTIYFCGNMQELAPHEKNRVETYFRKYANFLNIEHYSLERLVAEIAQKPRRKIDGWIHFIDDNYFERPSGNIRGVIGVVSALDLIELIKDKNNPERIEEAIFEDNIRIYQGRHKSNPINQAIYDTALNKAKNYEFFYLNNGITMTCDKVDYLPVRHPRVELKNVQIVNGSQTSHALFEAYQSLPESEKILLDKILILVRIYQTDKDIVQRIVETTNSQTVITSRDLKANDHIQRKIEIELLDKGYFYEKKTNLYQDKPTEKRLDAQVVGQVLMAFYLDKPDQVKYQRREIFGKHYSEVFNENVINADSILTPMSLFQYIEQRKNKFRKEVLSGQYDKRMLFLPHASFYILFGIKVAAKVHNLQFSYMDVDKVIKFYEHIVDILATLVEIYEEQKGKGFSLNSFFRDRKIVYELEREVSMDKGIANLAELIKSSS